MAGQDELGNEEVELVLDKLPVARRGRGWGCKVPRTAAVVGGALTSSRWITEPTRSRGQTDAAWLMNWSCDFALSMLKTSMGTSGAKVARVAGASLPISPGTARCGPW